MNGQGFVTAKNAGEGIINWTTEFMKDNFNEEVAKIVNQHGAAAAVSAVAALFPGAGPTACMVAQTTVVYSMYVRMNHALGIKLNKNVMKALASAVIGNLVGNVSSIILGLVGATILSLIPGLGNAAATLTMIATGYATVMISALCYGKTLLSLSKLGRNIEHMSESEIENAVKHEMSLRDLNADVEAYTNAYKQGRRDGTFTGKEHIDLED